MTKTKALPIITRYWKPGHDFLQEIVGSVQGKIDDDDIIVISEKAISTALGKIVDESLIEPGLSARFIARFWMRTIWGYVLGPMCHLRKRLLKRIREYPSEMGSVHKQVVLQHAGLLQALMFGSEGGIDGSNLPYSYVSLPLKDAFATTERIRTHIRIVLKKNICTMIVDTDKTYSFRNFHFTPRPRPMKGIHSFGGFFTYFFGRMFKLKTRATPLGIAGCNLQVERALEIAEKANRVRGFGAGRTVWEMAGKFNVDLTGVSWEMLETVKHKPIVILRTKR